jgi:glycosyl transferase family 25
MKGIDRVFVLHCKAGYETRQRSIDTQFQRLGIEFEYILDWDVPEFTSEVMEQYFRGNLIPSMKSVGLKHVRAMQRILEEGLRRCIIFEDDILLGRNFPESVEEIVHEAQGLGENHVIYLSNSGNKYTARSRRRRGQRLYENDHSRAADAYIVTEAVCRKRLKWIRENRISLAIDHQFNVMDRELGIAFYWAEDPIAEQGSMTGLFPSHVENRYSPIVRKLRWKFDRFYKKNILRNLR